jgi:hypothetical protein
MRRLSLLFLPFLAAFALVFGLYYLYAAFKLIQLGRTVPAGLVFLFGLMGVGLAVAIWMAKRRAAGAPSASSDRDRRNA